MGIGQTLGVTLSEGPLQVDHLDACAPGFSDDFQWRAFSIIAVAMRPMWQPALIANQFTMKFDGCLDRLASFPVIFTDPGLNAELTLNGLITNDKFCMSRPLRLALTQPRHPLAKQ